MSLVTASSPMISRMATALASSSTHSHPLRSLCGALASTASLLPGPTGQQQHAGAGPGPSMAGMASPCSGAPAWLGWQQFRGAKGMVQLAEPQGTAPDAAALLDLLGEDDTRALLTPSATVKQLDRFIVVGAAARWGSRGSGSPAGQ